MNSQDTRVILCNNANGPKNSNNCIRIDYDPNNPGKIFRLDIIKLIQSVNYVSDRVRDLLEIASYLFVADRTISRGSKDAVEYHSWSRSFKFYIKVRDFKFWNSKQVKSSLSDALKFMTGDAKYEFVFEKGHYTPPVNLFDHPNINNNTNNSSINISLFSGGIDSLCGAIDLLENSEYPLYLVSHQSRTSITHTQNSLIEYLKSRYPNRVEHFPLVSTLKSSRAPEETQRTRTFLYSIIAYFIASAFKQETIYIFENGITSINLYRREDLANARASRTTHPNTIKLMSNLLSLVADKDIHIKLPYLFLTKSDVIHRLCQYCPKLITSTVSCSKAFPHGQKTHCGMCFQCIDRRIASHVSNAQEWDHNGLYCNNIISDEIPENDSKNIVIDYIRQAISFANDSLDKFENDYLSDIVEFIDYVDGNSDEDKFEKIWLLFRKHGEQVKKALTIMREKYDDPYQEVHKGSLLGIVAEREYLKPDYLRLAEKIKTIVIPTIGNMFSSEKPKNEPDFNTKINALLTSHYDKLRSEFPITTFACAQVIPDHQLYDILLEAKYIRENTPPSKANEGIAADLFKYPENNLIIFIVYDPTHAIKNDNTFIKDIESKGRNQVWIIR